MAPPGPAGRTAGAACWIPARSRSKRFAVHWTAYSPPPSTGWVDPAGDPPALTAQAALEAPYEAVKNYPFQGTDVAQAVVMAARGSPGLSMGYKVYVEREVQGSWFVPSVVPYFTPSGTLATAIDERTSEIVVTAGPDTDRVQTVSGPTSLRAPTSPGSSTTASRSSSPSRTWPWGMAP